MNTIQETQHSDQSTPERRGMYVTQAVEFGTPMVGIVNDCWTDPVNGELLPWLLDPNEARDFAGTITAMSLEVDYQRAALRPEVRAAIERVRAALADQTDMTVVEVMEVDASLGINAVDLMRYAEAAKVVSA